MNNKDNWEEKFVLCSYANKLLNLLYEIEKHTKNPVDITQIKKAIYYARKYHGSQLRKSGEPYYSHPIEVACIFVDYVTKENIKYFTTDLIITAILHDTIEDTELTEDMITQIFNRNVANKVIDLTRVKLDRKITAAQSVAELFLEYKKDVLYVKLFDRVHNMRTIGSMKPEKIKKIAEETINYFLPLASYLALTQYQEELIDICSEYYNIRPHLSSFQNPKISSSFNSSQFLSLVFQNNKDQN
jgi:(p)ppGpp synthase/HD superfamily hydrolase